jgi:hypothetical protein
MKTIQELQKEFESTHNPKIFWIFVHQHQGEIIPYEYVDYFIKSVDIVPYMKLDDNQKINFNILNYNIVGDDDHSVSMFSTICFNIINALRDEENHEEAIDIQNEAEKVLELCFRFHADPNLHEGEMFNDFCEAILFLPNQTNKIFKMFFDHGFNFNGGNDYSSFIKLCNLYDDLKERGNYGIFKLFIENGAIMFNEDRRNRITQLVINDYFNDENEEFLNNIREILNISFSKNS